MMNKIQILLVTLLFLICCSTVMAQEEGDFYFSIADSLYDIDQYGSAIVNFEKAAVFYKKDKEWEKLAETIGLIINSFIQMETYEKAIPQESEVSLLVAQKELQYSLKLAKTCYRLAHVYERLEQFGPSFKYYEKAIDIFETIEVDSNDVYYVVMAYRNAAQTALRKLDYPKAIEYLKKGLAENYSEGMNASLCVQLANTFFFLNDYDEQFKYIQQGLTFNPKPSTMVILNTNLSDYYLQEKNYKEAEQCTLDALDYYNSDADFWAGRIGMYIALAGIYEAQGLNKKVLASFEKAEEEIQQYSQRGSRDGANLYINIGEYHFKNNNLEKALNYFQKALLQVFPDFQETDVLKNPSVDQVYEESWIMDAAAAKAKALKKRFESDGNLKNLEVATACYQLVIATVKKLNRSYETESSKIYMGDYGFTYFEEAIDIQYLLYERSSDLKHLEEIFSLMEQSKAVVLSEAIQKNKAIIEAAIPDSLLTVERNIRASIADKNIELIKYKQLGNVRKVNSLEMELFGLANDYEKHLRFLKERYPKFQSLSEEFNSPSILDVQSFIADDSTVLIEYFAGNKNIYVLMISEEQIAVRKIETQKTNHLIADFLSYFKNANQFLETPDSYFKTAHQLYLALFSDLLNTDVSFQNIIIIPDGELKRVPFEAMVDQSAITGEYDFNHYLIDKYLIYFSNSASLLLYPKLNVNEKGYFLNVAPGFLEKERGMIPLTHSNKEVESIKKTINLLGKDAKLSSFKNMAEGGSIIHLSTHAKAGINDEIPKIEFIDTSLFLPGVYALNLKADLVVLSACESQLGELKRGEGVMSLGRGFFYAGASSLVASLWSVNEQSTANIFSDFYLQVQNGKPKAEALRLAKLDYLKNAKSDLKKSPYYWAGFVYLGNNETVEINTRCSCLKTGLLIVVGGLFLWLIYFFRRRNT